MDMEKKSFKTFGLIGLAGYIAPRHMKAIKAIGGELKVALDPKDTVGVVDGYFPDTEFFNEFENFDRYLALLRSKGDAVDCISICSPNYLHGAHCRYALRVGAHAICEKPLVIDPKDISDLSDLELSTGKKIFAILQLRLHPAILALRSNITAWPQRDFDVELTYVVPRGRWYRSSWKDDDTKSGGLVANIGIHFFDALSYLFGAASMSIAHLRDRERASGTLICGRARISWFLSIDRNDLPSDLPRGPSGYRSIIINGTAVDLSDGFADLHTRSYEHIVSDGGFRPETARPAIEMVANFYTLPLKVDSSGCHPFAKRHIRR